MSRRKQENPQPRKRLVNSSDECPSLGLTTTREAIDGREEVDFGDGDGMERMDESEEDGGNEVIYVSNDMLTCGDCQMEFALSDILKFIDHKIVLCSKGNCRPNSKTPDENDDGATEALELEDDGDDREENVDPLVNSNGTSGNGASVKKQTPSIITCSQRQKLKYLQGKGNGQHMCINSQKIHHHHRPCGPGLVNNRTAHATSPGVKQTVDAHTNTINTEPLSLACRTCKQVFHSSWALLQHAQSVHGSQLYIENFSNEPSMLPPIDGQTPGVPHLGASLATGLHIHSNGPSSLSSTHPALSLLRMPSQDRPFPATFLAAAAAAAAVSRPLGGSGPSHSDLFSSSPSSVLNHPVASLLADAHNLFSAAAASETQCGRSGNGTRSLTGTSSLPTPSGHQSSSLSSFEPHIDFYSQRLRQLAGATSPGSARTSVSPVRKLTPPSFPSSVSSAIATTANTAVTTTTCDIQSSNRSGAPSQQQPGSPKHKECEYCGKSFRFMSNLIVHRRSHTGEKPYKCDICNHACTQASKLKRHMKTHYRGSQTAQNVNSVLENTTDSMLSQADSSAGGTPTSGLNNSRTELATTNGGDIDMDDEDIEDEDEDEEEEDLGDEEKEDEDPGEGENSRNSSVEMVAEDLSTGGVGASAKKGTSNGTSYKSNNSPKENSPGAAAGVQSLIGEVMENIGLSGIQQYNEAYKQALEEQVKVGPGGSCGAHNNGSSRGGVKQERPSSSSSHISSIGENGPSLNNLFKHQSPLLSHSNFNDLVGPLGASMNHTSNALGGVSGSLISSAFDHHNPFDPKRLKLDLTSNEHRDPLYAGLWLPAMANPFTASFAHLTSEASSGISAELAVRSKIISESAFNKTSSISANSSPRAGPSLGRGSTPPSANRSSPSSGHNSATPPTTNLTGTPGRKEGGARTRNDTCEYCGKVFKNCSNLTVHRRSHTGEKPYKCELCSYACAQSSKLTRHMKTHGRLGKDVYRCRFCEMPFSVPSTLEKHMRKCVVNQNNNAAANVVASANSSSSNLQLIPCLTSNTSNSNDPGSDT